MAKREGTDSKELRELGDRVKEMDVHADDGQSSLVASGRQEASVESAPETRSPSKTQISQRKVGTPEQSVSSSRPGFAVKPGYAPTSRIPGGASSGPPGGLFGSTLAMNNPQLVGLLNLGRSTQQGEATEAGSSRRSRSPKRRGANPQARSTP